MSPRKLSDGDRQEILHLYRTTKETTSTLATHFGVSSSTISRFLKSNLSTLEYEDLIQEKRLARTANYQGDYDEDDYGNDNSQNYSQEDGKEDNKKFEEVKVKNPPENQQQLSLLIETESQSTTPDLAKLDNSDVTSPSEEIKPEDIKLKDNSQEDSDESLLPEKEKTEVKNTDETENQTPSLLTEEEEKQEIKPIIHSNQEKKAEDDLDSEKNAPVLAETEKILEKGETEKIYLSDLDLDEVDDLESVDAIHTMFGEDIDDYDDNGDDWDDDDEDEDDEEIIIPTSLPQLAEEVKVLPLSQAVFPRKCYLAVDRSAELMTRLLKDFNELGKIPPEETKQKTLPVFDNHRVAKRFCDRKGKVIKLPNGKMLEKTSNYLNAKGITRLLINGKIYSLT